MVLGHHWRLIWRVSAGLAVLALVLLGLRFSYLLRPTSVDKERSMRPVSMPRLSDGLPLEELAAAIEQQVDFLGARPTTQQMQFGPAVIPSDRYRSALLKLAARIRESHSVAEVLDYVQRSFTFFEVYGAPRWGEVFVTGYFEPIIRGARVPTTDLSQPLYAQPSDLLKLDLSRFDECFRDQRPLRARVDGGQVVPYYSRAEIDSGKALQGQGLELCWVDPIDAFFLQVQGSGVVQLEDGTQIKLGYAEKNGHRYEAIGKLLKDAMEPIPPTYPNLVAYLRGLSRKQQQEALNLNPSYVFFQESSANAVTALGVPATAGRTVATDHALFPAGALAFLDFSSAKEGGGAAPPSRFVLNQDVGGAIKGAGRVDLFFGRGQEAGASAGVLQQRGRLYYLVPR